MAVVPTSLVEISPDWLTAVLGKQLPDAIVADAAVAPLHNVANYNGNLAKVHLQYRGSPEGAPQSLVAKLVPQNDRMLHLGVSLGVYRREAALYDTIGGATAVAMPHLYGFTEDPDAGISALLLEDLSHLCTGDQAAGFTAVEAQAAVMQFARQHAAWWNRAELASHLWLPSWDEPAMVDFAVGAYAQIWPACAAMFADTLPAEAIRLGERLTERLADMMARVAAPPVTLVHGDARHENLMFDPADDSAAPFVVDWQFVARGRGIMDIAYYLSQSGAPDIAASIERDLVARYHDALCHSGVGDYSAAQCWEDYRRFVYYALVYPVFAAGLADPENEAQRAAVTGLFERAVNAALRLDAGEFA